MHNPLEPEVGQALGTDIALAILAQVFEHGFYHADPHPGNFILMKDGRVGLIDFGNVGKCTPEMIDDLLLLVVTLSRRNYHGLARWILKQGQPTVRVNPPALASDLMDVLDPLYGSRLEDIQVGPLFNSLFEMVVRNGITVPAQYANVGRTLVLLEGVLRVCAPQLEVIPAIQPYAMQIFGRRWSPDRIMREVRGEAAELLSSLRSYPTNLAEVLRRAAEGNIEVKARVPEITNIVDKRLSQLSTRVPLALLAAGIMISSAILLVAGGEDATVGTQVAGYIGLFAALLVTVRLWLRG